MNMLQAEQLTFRVGRKQLIHQVDVSVSQGSFTAIVGPNGAGKTTLLNLLDGDAAPSAGQVMLHGTALATINRLDLARQRAVLPQLGSVPFAVKVRDIVALGREPYRYHQYQRYNQAVIDDCLLTADIADFARHHYHTLSGGEQHRVQIARTLAQIHHRPNADLSEKILFLDEPTNHLDIRHQYRLMHYLKQQQDKGLTIVAVMHDLSLTLQYAEQIILLNQGQKTGSYSPRQLVDSEDLSAVYQMNMRVRWDSEWQRYIIAPMM
ncbi:MAG: heme ABC transporter ATP-binding protein [Gammaproteobacteria bacterium]|nr:MAG: heme ABC transporter ATP-binding protein [Gammaproteobacteria bacterium]